jgi:SAM-dependent methyltransferase
LLPELRGRYKALADGISRNYRSVYVNIDIAGMVRSFPNTLGTYMGIAGNLMAGFIREAKFRPLCGVAYTLGRPTMAFTPAQTNILFKSLEMFPVGGEASLDQIDIVTLESAHKEEKPIRDVDFFKMLGFSAVKAIDVNDHEGAEIILDLNEDVPSKLVGTCDFLVDGSTLDNVFDPITALRNSVKLLKPDGRLYLSNLGNYSPHQTGIPYMIFTPMWFYDFFCVNGFSDCQVYVTVYEPDGDLTFILSNEFTTRQFASGFVKPIFSEYPMQISVFAEKNPQSTWNKTPIQHAYRNDLQWMAYEEGVRRFIMRERPPQLTSLGSQISRMPAPGWLLCLPDGTLKNPYCAPIP